MNSLKPYDKPLFKAFKILLAVAAYGFLAYKLITYKDYSSLLDTWNTLDLKRIGWLVCAIALFPINIFLEAAKWRFLLRDLAPISYAEAQRQVYCGSVGAFVTPYRLGDYPSRAMFLEDKTAIGKATVLGFVGGAALTLIIIVLGVFPAIYYLEQRPNPLWIILGSVLCLTFIFLAPRIIKTEFSFPSFLGTMGWSALRYLVFSFQLYAVLLFVGAPISPLNALISIPVYYLLVTITPNMPVADLGIRGSWAVLIFSRFAPIPIITLAILFLYIINTILPILVGSILLSRQPTK